MKSVGIELPDGKKTLCKKDFSFLRLSTLSAWTIKLISQSLILCEQNDVWWYFLSWNLGLMQYSLWVLNLNVSVFITCLHISHLVPSHDLQQPSFFSRGATLALTRKSLKFLAFLNQITVTFWKTFHVLCWTELANGKSIILYKNEKVDPCLVFLFVFWILKEKLKLYIYTYIYVIF